METIGLRLKKYLEYKEVARIDFCDAIDIKYNSLSRIINGSAAMNSETLNKIFTYFPDLNTRWFITGKGPMEYTISSYFINQEEKNPIVKKEPMYDREELLRTFIEDEHVLNTVRNPLDKALEQSKRTENKE